LFVVVGYLLVVELFTCCSWLFA